VDRVDPVKHMIDVYRRDSKVSRYSGSDLLDDDPTLPGLTLSLPDLFSGE
jgi:hypothetical protein